MKTHTREIYTVQQAADMLQVHRNTITRWRKEGRISLVHLPGRQWRVSANEIDRILAQRTEQPTPEA